MVRYVVVLILSINQCSQSMSSIIFKTPYHVLLYYLLTAVPQHILFQKSFPLTYHISTTNISEALEDLNESLEDVY